MHERPPWTRFAAAVLLPGVTALLLVIFGHMEGGGAPDRDGAGRPGDRANPLVVVDAPSSAGEVEDLARLVGLVDGRRMRCRQLDGRHGAIEVDVEVEGAGGGGLHRRRMIYRFPDGRVQVQEAVYRVEADRVLLVSQLLSGGVFQDFEPGQVLVTTPLRPGTSWEGVLRLVERAPRRPVETTPSTVPFRGRIVGRETLRLAPERVFSCWKIENRAGGYVEELWLHEDEGEIRRVLRKDEAVEGASPLMTLERRP